MTVHPNVATEQPQASYPLEATYPVMDRSPQNEFSLQEQREYKVTLDYFFLPWRRTVSRGTLLVVKSNYFDTQTVVS